jgi:predicted enzyme related to lactoylglutathione lyase
MGTRESYEPGTFSWVELATSDADGAKRFYTELFGWDYDDNPLGEGAVYSMAKVDGQVVGALYASEQPPHWNSYVTVKSADEAAEAVKEAGGTVAAEPFDVLESGRMLVIQDPTGAPLCLWEPKAHIGAGLVNAPGALTWNDLMTTDVERAAEFYCEVFGWEVAPVEDAPDERLLIRNGERLNGGMAKLPEGMDEVPPHWLPYFAVDDVDAAVETVKGGEGTLIAGPLDVPNGRFAVCADPQGATFAVFAGEFDD